MQVQIIILALVVLWLLGLTASCLWILRIFNSLTKGVGSESLVKVLDKVLVRLRQDSEEIKDIKKEIGNIHELDKFHVQKMGMVRFNPFRETGGDHSFSIAFLDETDSGLVLTGIHTRERTRVYMKEIKNGKGEFELSNEEKKALSKAQKTRN